MAKKEFKIGDVLSLMTDRKFSPDGGVNVIRHVYDVDKSIPDSKALSYKGRVDRELRTQHPWLSEVVSLMPNFEALAQEVPEAERSKFILDIVAERFPGKDKLQISPMSISSPRGAHSMRVAPRPPRP